MKVRRLLFLGLITVCYSHIKPSIGIDFLHNYERDFTVLTLGDNALKQGLLIANDFDNSSVIITHTASSVESISNANVCVLNFVPSEYYLNILSECEHFDVIFFSGKSFTIETFEHLKSMSDYMVLDVPIEVWQEYRKKCQRGIPLVNEITQKGYCRGIIKTNNENILKRRSIVWPPLAPSREKIHKVISTFDKKTLEKYLVVNPGNIEQSNWSKGINLVTFIFLKGIFPTKEKIKEELKQLCEDETYRLHSDPSPANLIISGTTLHYIDVDQKRSEDNLLFQQKMNFVHQFIDFKDGLDLEKLREAYWKTVR